MIDERKIQRVSLTCCQESCNIRELTERVYYRGADIGGGEGGRGGGGGGLRICVYFKLLINLF